MSITNESIKPSNSANEVSPRTEELHPELLKIVHLLRRIQADYHEVVAQLREEFGIRNRGCGPSSFALAMILQECLELPIDASFAKDIDPADGIHIVYGLELEERIWIDHAWIEVTYKGQTILVSHESSAADASVSFRAAALYTQSLGAGYGAFGIKRLAESGLREMELCDDHELAVSKVVEEINKGKVPEMYLRWFQCMMLQLY